MIQLRLLGAIGLESAAGPITGRAAQKRRLALLALLALAPARTLARDKLIALLWPESSTEHARHLLSVALHELRKALGEDALITLGDDIRLGPAITTDVDRLDAALRSGDADAALGALGGPLLDGFHLRDSHEFEDWLEQERAQFTERCAAGLEALAAQLTARGDALAAVAVWRRRVALDPYNGRVALALMRALDAAGDRAGALQHARVHALLLREEFGTEADAELVAYAEELRVSPAPRAGTRVLPDGADPPAPAAAEAAPVLSPAVPAATPSAPERGHAPRRFGPLRGRLRSLQALAVAALLLSVGGIATVLLDRADRGPRVSAAEAVSLAVLPFRATDGAAQDEPFGEGLTVWLGHALTRAGLRLAPLGSVLQLEGERTAREVGGELAVAHVLEGTFARGANDVRVTVSLVRVADGRTLWTEMFRRQDTWEEVLQLQDDIAHAVIEALNPAGAMRVGTGPLAMVSPDERASAAYREGVMEMVRRTQPNLGAALGHFQRAIALDSTFARAHAAVAEVHTLLGAYDYGMMPPKRAFPAARDAAERALLLDPNLAEAHAALAAVSFNYDWDWNAAERRFLEAVRLNRGFASAWQWYSLLLSARGRHEEAIRASQYARQLDPVAPVFRSAAARSHYFARDFDRAVAGFQEAVAHDSTFLTAHLGLGLSYAVSGRADQAIRHYLIARALPGGNAPVVAGLLGHAYGLAGRTAEARAELGRLQEAAAAGYVPAEYRVLIHLGLGERGAALEALEYMLANRSNGVAYLRADPVLDPLRQEPRFKALLRDAGI